MRHEVVQDIGMLDRVVWNFSLMDYHGSHVIFLESMSIMNRESPRHKFKVDFQKSYSRLNNREFRLKDEPEVPIEISVEAVHALRKTIKFQKWPRTR